MSTTIMMPSSFDASIREMCSDAISQAIATLSAKYGFDPEEAARVLADTDVKLVRKRGPAAKVDSKAKAKAPAKAKDDSDKPKRAKTGYLTYADHVRSEVREAMEAELTAGEKLKPQDVVRSIAAQWKGLDEDKQKAWALAAKGGMLPAYLDEELVGEEASYDKNYQEQGEVEREELSDLEEDDDDDEDDDDE